MAASKSVAVHHAAPAFQYVTIRYQGRPARFAIPLANSTGSVLDASNLLRHLVVGTFNLGSWGYDSGLVWSLGLAYDEPADSPLAADSKIDAGAGLITLPFDVSLLEGGRTYELQPLWLNGGPHASVPVAKTGAQPAAAVTAAAHVLQPTPPSKPYPYPSTLDVKYSNPAVTASPMSDAVSMASVRANTYQFAPSLPAAVLKQRREDAAATAAAAGDSNLRNGARLPTPAEAAAQVEAEAAAAEANPPLPNAGGSSDPIPPDTVVASFSYTGRSATELTFKAGDKIKVLSQYDKDWWKGTCGDDLGFFPANHVIGLERVVLAESVTKKKAKKSGKAGGGAKNKKIKIRKGGPSKLHEHEKDENGNAKEADGDGDAEDGTDDTAGEDLDYQDTEYFDSYSTLLIHHQMLSDTGRTLAYQQAVAHCREQIQGKIVLDVGCGSGILTLFCALYGGAKHVYAAEASEAYYSALKVVTENKMNSRVTILKGKIEDIALPVEKVDVIISEWMGTFLVCESMIESVLWARAKYLQPDGLMMPSFSTLYLCPLSCENYYNHRIPYWTNVHGVKMGSLMGLAKQHFFEKPVYNRAIKPNELISDPRVVYELDSHTGTPEGNLESSTTKFTFIVNRSGPMHGFGSWFDVEFATDQHRADKSKIILYTDPGHKPTHWKQVMFIFPDPLTVLAGDTLIGSITINRNVSYRRHFHSVITFSHQLTGSETATAAATPAAGDTKSSPAANGAAAAAVETKSDAAANTTAAGTKAATDLGSSPSVDDITSLKLGTEKEPLYRARSLPRIPKDYEFRYDMWR